MRHMGHDRVFARLGRSKIVYPDTHRQVRWRGGPSVRVDGCKLLVSLVFHLKCPSVALAPAVLYRRLTLIGQVLLLCFAVFIQISVHYGLGKSFLLLTIDQSADAIFWTYVANTFAITGNAMAKLSMGFFLLRVVQVRWHKMALWAAVAVTSATSIALTIMLWNQTTPVKASWDVLRTPGTWNIQIQPMSVGLGGK
jgi:hypothetical protein